MKIIGLEGKKIGHLKILKESTKKTKERSIFWECICDCGNVFIARGSCLKNKQTKSCGCGDGINHIGEKYGFLTILEKIKKYDNYTGYNKTSYKCQCDCGVTKHYTLYQLKTETISCGNCLYRRLDRNESVWKKIYQKFKAQAKNREIKFKLTLEEIKKTCSEPCYYCGTLYSLNKKDIFFKENKVEINYNGIDRIDSDKNYEMSNVVPSCKICNVAKHTMSDLEFRQWIEQTYDFITKNNI